MFSVVEVKSPSAAGSLKKDQLHQQKWEIRKNGGKDFTEEEIFELDFGPWVEKSSCIIPEV